MSVVLMRWSKNKNKKTVNAIKSTKWIEDDDLPVIYVTWNIPMLGGINSIWSLPLDQSTHVINVSINLKDKATTLSTIPGIPNFKIHIFDIIKTLNFSCWQLRKMSNLRRLLFASCSSITSPTYSHTNVPRVIGSPALTAQPWV